MGGCDAPPLQMLFLPVLSTASAAARSTPAAEADQRKPALNIRPSLDRFLNILDRSRIC